MNSTSDIFFQIIQIPTGNQLGQTEYSASNPPLQNAVVGQLVALVLMFAFKPHLNCQSMAVSNKDPKSQ